MAKVFIDGAAGTTGLKIYDRLSSRSDIELIILPDELRKDEDARADAVRRSDITFLCLPDDAAKQAVTLTDDKTVIIDTSTAHRTADGWVYGMPELEGQTDKIKTSKRIANPGCHASGFIALVAPLISNGIIDKSALLSCFSLTGYSGGGKKMIAEYESEDRNVLYEAPRQYGLSQSHKHLPEMKAVCGLDNAPVFCPVVAPFYSGMEVTVPLFDVDIEKIKEIYSDTYNGVIQYKDPSENGFVSAGTLSGKDSMYVYVYGSSERAVLCAVYDNLGKGASGAAIQNMNIILNEVETKGLIL